MRKRFTIRGLALTAGLIVLFSAFTNIASADSITPRLGAGPYAVVRLVPDKEVYAPGEIAKVSIVLEEASIDFPNVTDAGITSWSIPVEWNPAILTLTGARAGDMTLEPENFSYTDDTSTLSEGYSVVGWSLHSVSADVSGDQRAGDTLAVLTFEVSASAESGTQADVVHRTAGPGNLARFTSQHDPSQMGDDPLLNIPTLIYDAVLPIYAMAPMARGINPATGDAGSLLIFAAVLVAGGILLMACRKRRA